MIEGLDISGDFQDVGSFHDVAASGIGFVYVKATEGQSFAAGRFTEYAGRIRSVGLKFGAYHFLHWDTDAVAQANFFLSVYGPQSGDLAPMLDCEAFTGTAAECTEHISKFLNVVEPHLNGKRMLIYCDYDAIKSQAFESDEFAGHPLWMADYNSPMPAVPATWSIPTIWQYSDGTGLPNPPSIVANGCDRDRFLGSDLSPLMLA